MSERQMLDDEKWTRITIGMGHTIGGAVLTGLGAGAVVQPLGDLETGILDAAFADRMAPSPVLNERAREVVATATPAEPAYETPPVVVLQSRPKRWDSKSNST